MAILRNPIDKDFRGHVDKTIVIKQYATKTVITADPDMSNVAWSAAQLHERSRFQEAVAYAKAIINDPEQKAALQARLGRRKRVFNAAISEYMRKPVPAKNGYDRGTWIADANGIRPFTARPSALPEVRAAEKHSGRGLVKFRLIPRSAKRPFERRMTEPEPNQTLFIHDPYQVFLTVKPPSCEQHSSAAWMIFYGRQRSGRRSGQMEDKIGTTARHVRDSFGICSTGLRPPPNNSRTNLTFCRTVAEQQSKRCRTAVEALPNSSRTCPEHAFNLSRTNLKGLPKRSRTFAEGLPIR